MKTKKIVFVSGAFDVLHPGHLDFFRQAKELGDYLIVVLGRDDVIEQVKGARPWESQEERLKKIQDVECVDEARIGYPGSKYTIVGEIKPDIIALGYDQMPTEELQAQLDEMGLDTKIVRLEPFHPDKYKSSIIKAQKGRQEGI